MSTMRTGLVALALVLQLPLLVVLAACGGEPSDESVAERERAATDRQAQVEGRLCLHDRIVKLWDEWDEWLDDKSGGADFKDLSNGEKMSILNKFDDFLDDLKDAAKDVC